MINKELGINDWIEILYEAWSKMLGHYRKLGIQGGYFHTREEDVRSFLFSKILNVMEKKKLSLLDLHTEVSLLPRQRADITVGYIDENHCKMAIEIKPHKHIGNDVDKLTKLIEHKNIEAGACLAMVERSWNPTNPSRKLSFWETDIYREIKTKFEIESKDQDDNNFVKWKHIEREGAIGTKDYWHHDFDAMFLILRKAEI